MSRASNGGRSRVPVPRDREDDYSEQAVRRRLDFARERCGAELKHVSKYSFDPAMLSGNIEHFIGVAQVPIGLAGPLLVNGEHAQGEFYVPMATAEGTLVASYNAGCACCMRPAGSRPQSSTTECSARLPSCSPPRAKRARSGCG